MLWSKNPTSGRKPASTMNSRKGDGRQSSLFVGRLLDGGWLSASGMLVRDLRGTAQMIYDKIVTKSYTILIT